MSAGCLPPSGSGQCAATASVMPQGEWLTGCQHSHHTRHSHHTHALAGGWYFSQHGKTLLYKGSSLRIPLGFGLCEFPWEVITRRSEFPSDTLRVSLGKSLKQLRAS